MNKFLYSTSILSLLFLVVGSIFFPNDVLMWFASTETSENIIRICLSLLLLLLIIAVPPRHISVRIFLGLTAVALAAWTIYGFNMYELHLLDAIIYTQLCIIFSIAALEISYEDEGAFEQPHHVPTPSIWHTAGAVALSA